MRHDDDNDPKVPFPTVPVSNGEWLPPEVTDKQRLVGKLIAEECEAGAKRHGMTRGRFLRTAAATTTAFMVMNRVYGLDAWGDNAVLPVKKEHCDDLDGARELLDHDVFVMDVQTHHIDIPAIPVELQSLFCFLDFIKVDPCPESIGQMSYLREMFLDSQTSVAVISGLPQEIGGLPPGIPLGPATMAATRDLVNGLAGSQRCLAQAVCDPRLPDESPTSIASMAHQVNDLGGAALKCYTYSGNWFLDDEAVGVPMIEEARRLGLSLINVHKGLPLKAFQVESPQYVRAIDIPNVARAFPDMNFCTYHSAYFSAGDHPEGLDAGYHPEDEPVNPGRWGNVEYLSLLDAMPRKERRNVYTEIGSTFAFLLAAGPEQAAHLLGRLLQTFDSKHILWGTDSIWWGSPQYLIDAFLTLQIPASLREQYGYSKLSKKTKKRILGLNAAKLYGLTKDDRQKLCALPDDSLTQAQAARGGYREGRSLRVYGPQTRRAFLSMFGTKGPA